MWLMYDQVSGSLVYLDDAEPSEAVRDVRLVVEYRDAVVPDLRENFWNPSILDFQQKLKSEYTPLEFMNAFTMQERIAFRNSTDPVVIDIFDQLKVATSIITTDPRTIGALQYLVATGALTQDRMKTILG